VVQGALVEAKTDQPSPARTDAAPLSRTMRLVILAVVIAGFVPALGSDVGLLILPPYALVAAVLILRMPRHPIGWLLLLLGWSFALGTMTVPATSQQMADGTAPVIAWIAAWAAGTLGGSPGFVLLFALAVIFPSGRFPAGRWGLASRLAIVFTSAILAGVAFAPTLYVTLSDTQATGTVPVRNPIGLLPDAAFWPIVMDVGFIPLVLLFGAGALSLVVRLRRATGVERQQLQWVVAALGFTVLAILSGLGTGLLFPAFGETGLIWIPALISFPLIPISIGIAVLRYRLYEIDVLVNRTLLYGGATLVIAVAFGGANVVLQRVVESVAGQRSDFVAAAVGAGAALTVSPLIRAIRPIVDRVLPSRAVLALLFTDIVGSTEKIVELGDEPWRQLLGRYRGAMRAELSRFSGHEVNTAGDSFFATFGSPTAALDCARAMRDTARALGLETRTGLHYAEVELRGEQVSGLEVHAAARVMAEAGAGQVVVSAALRETLAGSAPFADLGTHELKGVPGTWQLYRLLEGAS
jgi:class 3 adenylate cyclase